MSSQLWHNGLLLYALLAMTVLMTACSVNTLVPDPYMDEIFHIRQAQTFARTWYSYDSKLTTPPGLYIPSALLARYVTSRAVSVPALRAVNAGLLLYLPWLFSYLIPLVRRERTQAKIVEPQRGNIEEAITITAFPLVFFFAFLFYTDLASLVLVLQAYKLALQRSYSKSAVVGLLSLTLRQTNILWIAFIAFAALTTAVEPTTGASRRNKVKVSQKKQERNGSPHPPSEEVGFLRSLIGDTRFTVASIMGQPLAAIRIVGPYIPVAVVFVAFLLWNGGIVLAIFVSPHILNRTIVAKTLVSFFGSTIRMTVSILICAAIVWTIFHYTFEHPFLLADNRHYTFYIWKRLVNFSSHGRYMLAPAYLACFAALYQCTYLSGTWDSLSFLAFWLITAITLMPSPLLEFRYFIIPFIIFRLHLKPTSLSAVRVEALLYASINIITTAIFLWRPFRWPTEDGWQRFMW